MQKNYLLILISLLFIIVLSGCGSDSTTVPVVFTPTIQPTAQPTSIITPTPQVISTLTEIEAKRVSISAQNGGSVSEGDMEVIVPGNSLEQDSSVEIARVNINGKNASNKDGPIIAYEISTGNKNEEAELKEPATVKLKNATGNQHPVLYNGDAWLPIDDYSYDPNAKEISLEVNFIDDDTNEFIESGDEEAEVEAPVVIALNQDITYKYNFISSKNRFKVFYNDAQDEEYAKSIAATIEEAYDYYAGLGYKPPVKSLVNDKTAVSNYIYTYIYNDQNSRYDSSVGVAWTLGYMGFNRRILDMSQPRYKSTCYHELLHLTQYSYSGNRGRYESWFSESMCTSMQYFAINRPTEMYDVSLGGRWNSNILWDEVFNADSSNSQNNYNKYIIWSYLVKKSDIKLFNDIMTDLKPVAAEDPELLNNAFQKKFNKSLPTLMNELIEDYYIYGAFFNKNYFYKLSNRPVNQPYGDIIERDGVTPQSWYNSYNIIPLSMRYICYSSANFRGIVQLNFDKVSANCKIKIFPMKYNDGTYQLGTVEEVTGGATKNYTMGENITNLFILIENTSMTTNATVNLSVSTL